MTSDLCSVEGLPQWVLLPWLVPPSSSLSVSPWGWAPESLSRCCAADRRNLVSVRAGQVTPERMGETDGGVRERRDLSSLSSLHFTPDGTRYSTPMTRIGWVEVDDDVSVS